MEKSELRKMETLDDFRYQETTMKELQPIKPKSNDKSHPANECDYKEKNETI